MRELFQQSVFKVGDEEYCWADIAIAAVVWGEWARLAQETREAMACLRSARDSGRPLPDAEIAEAAADFRYARELISADEAEAWLARWHLTASDWMEHVRRAVLRQKHQARLPELLERHAVPDVEVHAVMGVEAICTGLLTRLAPKFAARAAVYERLNAARDNGHPLFTQEELAAAATESPAALRALGIDVEEDRLAERCARVAALELAVERFRGDVVTPKAVADQVAAHHLDWIRVEYQTLAYPSESMAREALLCAREDGMSFLELATESELADLREEEQWIGEITGPLHAMLLGAMPGEVMGPFSLPKGHALLCLTSKRLPTADDEQVRSRAELAALRRALTHELQSRVQWLVEF
jgi:hypothetical protein